MSSSVIQILDPADEGILSAGFFDLILLSIPVWRCENQNQMNGSRISNFTKEVTGLRP